MSTLAKKVEVLLALVNRVTGPANQIMGSLNKLTGATARAKMAIAALGETKGFQRLKAGIGGIAGQISGLAAPILALGGGAGLAGILGAVKATSDYADAMATAAEIAGVGAEQFQLMNYVAEQANVSTEDLSKSFLFLNKNIAAGRSGGKKQIEMFEAMGISVGELKSLSPEQVMKRLADSFEKIENPSLRSAAAMAFFGKAGASLLPALKGGSKAMEEGEQKAKRLGLALSDLDTDVVKDFGDNVGTLMKALEGVRNAIAVKVIPIIDPLVTRLTEWIAANRVLIATRVGDFVQRFAAWIERINFDRVLSGIESFMSGVQRLVDLVGGWGNAMAVLALSVTGLLGPLVQLTTGFLSMGAGLIALLGPIGIAIAVIAGLALAAYLIIDNWSSIGPFIKRLWGGIVDFLGGLVGTMIDIGGAIIGGLWRGMKAVFGTLLDWLKSSIRFVAELISWPMRALADFATNIVTGGGVNPMASLRNTAPEALGGNGFAGSQGAAQPSAPASLLPPGGGRTQIGGEMVVRFENQPPGMVVEKATTDTPGLTFRPDLGPAFGLA